MTLAVGDLTGDGRPELVITDALAHAVMVYRNASSPPGVPARRAPDHGGPDPPPVLATPAAAATAAAAGPAHLLPAGHGAVHRRHPRRRRAGRRGRPRLLNGRAGDDCVFGRSGDDRLSGGIGKDVLVGVRAATTG